MIRPADANETAAAWRVAVDRDGPTALILTRQDLPVLEGTAGGAGATRGAYVLRRRRRRRPTSSSSAPAARCRVCLDAADLLAADGVGRPGRVDAVLGPLRRRRTTTTRRRCCPPTCPPLAVEAGVTLRLGPLGRRRRRPSTASARRRPERWRSTSSAITPENVAERGPRALLDLTEEAPP